MAGRTMSDQLDILCLLGEPTRRALYDHVARAPEPVSRDEAARAVDVDRSVAAYHLDRLVEEGLLVPSYSRPEGRGGPGAGRPAKHYAPADVEVTASVPPRDYRLLAEILARALEAAEEPRSLPDALETAAGSVGRDLVRALEAHDLRAALEAHGFQPYEDGEVVRLRNCPFHQLAQQHTRLICGLNRALLSGVVEELGDADHRPQLDPAPGRCCVAFAPSREGRSGAR